ncbi:Chromosome-associated kinesin KIF4, partial [Stegodyphus mimosarum]
MNLVSSRSHAIFAVHVEQTDRITLNIIRSRFQLVDLAGSERIGRSKTEGVRLKEGININLGLLSLGNVISALAEEKSHIPYRDSKLTRLLMDTLGGNCHTLLIACVNPSTDSTEETVNTLRYAGRARRIRNTPVVNNDPPEVQIQKLKERIRVLEAQLYELQSTGIIKDSSENSDLRVNIKALQNQLQAALEKIANLMENKIQVEEKFEILGEKVKALYEEIVLCVTNLSSELEEYPNANSAVQKIKERCFELMEEICKDIRSTEVMEIKDTGINVESK